MDNKNAKQGMDWLFSYAILCMLLFTELQFNQILCLNCQKLTTVSPT